VGALARSEAGDPAGEEQQEDDADQAPGRPVGELREASHAPEAAHFPQRRGQGLLFGQHYVVVSAPGPQSFLFLPADML
jgi:hypothetical protein